MSAPATESAAAAIRGMSSPHDARALDAAVGRETFAERFLRLRKARGISRVVLAARVGCHFSAIQHIEAGDNATRAANLPNMARALGVSIDYLLTGHETPKLAALHRAIRVGASREQMLALINQTPEE